MAAVAQWDAMKGYRQPFQHAHGWQDHAACRGWQPEQLADHMGDRRSLARSQAAKICDGCTVSPECLAYAVAIGATVGLWAGRDAEAWTKPQRTAMADALTRYGIPTTARMPH